MQSGKSPGPDGPPTLFYKNLPHSCPHTGLQFSLNSLKQLAINIPWQTCVVHPLAPNFLVLCCRSNSVVWCLGQCICVEIDVAVDTGTHKCGYNSLLLTRLNISSNIMRAMITLTLKGCKARYQVYRTAVFWIGHGPCPSQKDSCHRLHVLPPGVCHNDNIIQVGCSICRVRLQYPVHEMLKVQPKRKHSELIQTPWGREMSEAWNRHQTVTLH